MHNFYFLTPNGYQGQVITTCNITKLYPSEDLCYCFPWFLALPLLHSLPAEVNPVPSAFPNRAVFIPFVALCICPPHFLAASAHSWMQWPSNAPAGSRDTSSAPAGQTSLEGGTGRGWGTGAGSAWSWDSFGGTQQQPLKRRLWTRGSQAARSLLGRQGAMGMRWTMSFRWDIRRYYFPMKTLKQWDGLPRKAVWSQSLEVFKAQKNETLSNLVWSHSWSWFEGEVGLETSSHPSQHYVTYGSVILWSSRWQNRIHMLYKPLLIENIHLNLKPKDVWHWAHEVYRRT